VVHDAKKAVETVDVLIQKSIDTVMRGQPPEMPASEDANKLTRQTEQLSQDPKNASKP
jgi:hypothetical protein